MSVPWEPSQLHPPTAPRPPGSGCGCSSGSGCGSSGSGPWSRVSVSKTCPVSDKQETPTKAPKVSSTRTRQATFSSKRSSSSSSSCSINNQQQQQQQPLATGPVLDRRSPPTQQLLLLHRVNEPDKTRILETTPKQNETATSAAHACRDQNK